MATNPIPYRPARTSFYDAPPEAPGFVREASTAWTLRCDGATDLSIDVSGRARVRCAARATELTATRAP